MSFASGRKVPARILVAVDPASFGTVITSFAGVAAALEKTRSSVTSVLGAPLRKVVKEWDCSRAAEALVRTRLVRPLWNPGSETDLNTFYHPCPIRRGRQLDQPLDVSSLAAARMVITGIVGQGK